MVLISSVVPEHGGEVSYKYRLSSNYVLTKYGRPSYFLRHRSSTPSHSGAPSPATSRPLSRISSLESMRETFYSAAGTPRSLNAQSPTVSHTNLQGYKQKHPSWLDMTLSAARANTSVPSLNTIGLQLASPMMSPNRMNSSAPTSGIRQPLDFKAQESLEETYYEQENSDTASDGEQEDTWDQESFESDSSKTKKTMISSLGRESRSSSLRSSPTAPIDLNRASSLARLRTQLVENDIAHVPASQGQSSGTLVSSSALSFRLALTSVFNSVTIQCQQPFLWLSGYTLSAWYSIIYRQTSASPRLSHAASQERPCQDAVIPLRTSYTCVSSQSKVPPFHSLANCVVISAPVGSSIQGMGTAYSTELSARRR